MKGKIGRAVLGPAAMAGDERDYNLTAEQRATKAKYPPLNKKYEYEIYPFLFMEGGCLFCYGCYGNHMNKLVKRHRLKTLPFRAVS
uniref:Uncharacterized protein n=1 Tax=Cairina moschata TaxID=8855 RepID=A0A8C3CQ48_CAIMO